MWGNEVSQQATMCLMNVCTVGTNKPHSRSNTRRKFTFSLFICTNYKTKKTTHCKQQTTQQRRRVSASASSSTSRLNLPHISSDSWKLRPVLRISCWSVRPGPGPAAKVWLLLFIATIVPLFLFLFLFQLTVQQHWRALFPFWWPWTWNLFSSCWVCVSWRQSRAFLIIIKWFFYAFGFVMKDVVVDFIELFVLLYNLILNICCIVSVVWKHLFKVFLWLSAPWASVDLSKLQKKQTQQIQTFVADFTRQQLFTCSLTSRYIYIYIIWQEPISSLHSWALSCSSSNVH